MQKITYKTTFRIALNITFVGILLFLMIEVIWAQLLKDLLLEENIDGILTGIILGGFFLAAVISIVSSLLSSSNVIRKYSIWAALIAFILNLFIWILISYACVVSRYPDVVADLSIWGRIIAIPRILAYFSIYFLSNVTLLWMFSLLTYAVIFSVVLYLLARKKSNKSYAYRHWQL